jgi:hypothetical protein
VRVTPGGTGRAADRGPRGGDDLDIAAVAGQTQSSVSAVKSRLHRGRRTLAGILGDDSLAGADDEEPVARRTTLPDRAVDARRSGLLPNEEAR